MRPRSRTESFAEAVFVISMDAATNVSAASFHVCVIVSAVEGSVSVPLASVRGAEAPLTVAHDRLPEPSV